MIVKWKTFGHCADIERVECTRETEGSVFVRAGSGERRHAKASDYGCDYGCYHDSWDAAKQHLMEQAEANLATARRAMHTAQDKLGNIKGMKKPKEESNG